MKKQNLQLWVFLIVFWVRGLKGQVNAVESESKKSSFHDSLILRRIYDEALLRGHSYARLGELCKGVGARLSGSDQAERGVNWAVGMLKSYQFDSVFLQPVLVPRWERGENDAVKLESPYLMKLLKDREAMADANVKINQAAFPHSPNPIMECEAFLAQNLKPKKVIDLSATALGGSIGGDLLGSLIVVKTRNQLDSLGKLGLMKGKIVLLAAPMDEAILNTFQAYGGCVNQRVNGANWCSPYGAIGVLVRSVSNRCDLHPHTGVTHYDTGVKPIPIAAIATSVADLLVWLVDQDPNLKVGMHLQCRTLPDRLSANIIAQTNGRKSPNQIISFGGHFDSWDEGEGAHDDGAGCMHAFEALRILKAVGYEPKHTLRCVFWINEENGLRGGMEYARLAEMNHELHVAALESDRGGFTPQGFGVDSSLLIEVRKFQYLLNQYGFGALEKGGGGADIGPLKKPFPSIPFVSFIPDSQRYFDVHHAETDVFESVNKRELELGCAAVAMMIYIIDQQLP